MVANGSGALTVAQYASDPVAPVTFSSTGEFFDVQVSKPNTFTSLTITDCNLAGGNDLQWFNPAANGGSGAWQPVSGVSITSTSPPCATTTLTDTSSPTLAQLTGTVFGVAATGSPTPTSSPSSPPRQALTLNAETPVVAAGSTAKLLATGAASQAYELRCYTRPSTTYVTARSGSFDTAGDAQEFDLSLGRNTRCFIQYATDNTQGTSPSVVVNVTTVLSLSTVRTATQTFVFQGRNLPRVAGQLITLYRLDNNGNEIRTSNLTTDSTGIYRLTRTFTGVGIYQFRVRTSQTLTNAAGASTTITVNVH